ncbi:hypothetical protein HED60_21195 [Planctomycetales bacterium ZRK34]|nr:hypothetical protein HED60_21195 [Planctomycetales bacterium ZRK34]
MIDSNDWQFPRLDPEDEALIDAYKAMRVPVDDLPHTPAITELVKRLDKPETDQSKHLVFKRLLRLRKMGRLPRLMESSSSSG